MNLERQRLNKVYTKSSNKTTHDRLKSYRRAKKYKMNSTNAHFRSSLEAPSTSNTFDNSEMKK